MTTAGRLSFPNVERGVFHQENRRNPSNADTSPIVAAKDNFDVLLIGTGQFDRVRLSEEAQSYFDSKGLKVFMKRTPTAIRLWNAPNALSNIRAGAEHFSVASRPVIQRALS